jgi:IS5 family transposase
LTFLEFESPFEGKFGQAKTAYCLHCIKARLSNTSQSWVAGIMIVLNLVHLAEVALLWILLKQLKLIFRQINDDLDYFFYSWKVNSNYRKIIVG